MSDRIYSIYKITNKINQKVYIGQTIQSLCQRWREHTSKKSHCVKLVSAMKKYGKHNFSIELIETCPTVEESNRKEVHWIFYYDSIENGYNIMFGGDNKTMSSDTKLKISKTKVGEKNPMYGKPAWNRNKKLTKTHTENLSISHLGQIPWNKGKTMSQESIDKMKNTKRNNFLKKKLLMQHS